MPTLPVPSGPSSLMRHARLVSGLSQNSPTAFEIKPTPEERLAAANELGFDDIRKLTFVGELEAEGERDWCLTGRLGASIVQPCVATLEPVVTRIDTPVMRRFLARWEDQAEAGSETEMPEDVTLEPLATEINPAIVMLEELVLSAPDFPRASDAAPLDPLRVTEPGKDVLSDEDLKPFAGLAALKAAMGGSEPDDPEEST